MITSVCGYQAGEVLAEGSQGIVCAASDGFSDGDAVMKIVRFKNSAKRKTSFQSEVSITNLLQGHENIVQLYGSQCSSDIGAFVMERAETDLLDVVSDGPLKPEDVKRIFKQICNGLQHCHENGVAHRDIKPENILICNGVAKLADFGAAYDTEEFGVIGYDRVGTEMYAAPEVLSCSYSDTGYNSFAADVWSAGIVLHVLSTGCWPYIDAQDVQYGLINIEEVYFNDDCLELLHRMLSANPLNRPSISEVLAHPFLSSRPSNPCVLALKASPRSHSVDNLSTKSKKVSLFSAAKHRLSSANRNTRLKVLSVVSAVLPSAVSRRVAL